MSIKRKIALSLWAVCLLFIVICIVSFGYHKLNNKKIITGAKPAFVFIGRSDCPVCKEEQPIWDSFVKKNENKEVSFKKINTKDPAYMDVIKLYDVKSVPTIAILNSNSELMYSKSGLHEESMLNDLLNQVTELEEQNKKTTNEIKNDNKNETKENETQEKSNEDGK